MKRTRFLWIRDLPTKCREHDVRGALQRFGDVQKVRILKDGVARYAIVAFGDAKCATHAISTGVKINDMALKMEYCDSFDNSGITLIKKSDTSCCQPHFGSMDKEQLSQELSTKNAHGHIGLGSTEHTLRNVLTSKRSNGRVTATATEAANAQVLRSVQNATNYPRPGGTFRGLKLTNLPPVSKLTDAQLRQGLFTELRRCGRIQSVVLPTSPEDASETGRIAIVTFRRSEEAECAYQALQSGEKLLFSVSVSAELHPGFESPDDCPLKSASNPLGVVTTEPYSGVGSAKAPLNSVTNLNSPVSKCPTRTLYIGGLTTGPTGPVTSEQLNTAFRKFGDIIDVQLRTSSNAALIQFAEMRGPMRAMNAHLRDPLRLGGRPLFLAYIPSSPSTGLWFSDLPPVLASMKDEELLRSLSNLAPVQEIILINRTDSNARTQSFQAPSTSVDSQNQAHYAAYIRLLSVEHAFRLLSELRSGKHFTERPDANASSPCRPTTKRPFAIDFASARQTSLVASLQLSAARCTTGSSRIRVISATSLDIAKRLSTNTTASLLGSPAGSSTLSSSSPVTKTHSVLSSPVRTPLKSESSPVSVRPTSQRPPCDSRYHLSLRNTTVNPSNTNGPTSISTGALQHQTPSGSEPNLTRVDQLGARVVGPTSGTKEVHRRVQHTGSSHNANFHNASFSTAHSLDRMEMARDISPSSLSTSSSSSSLSSESSSSSSSSSSCSSSSVSSPSSSSDDSNRSPGRPSLGDQTAGSTKSNRMRCIDAVRSSHRTRTTLTPQTTTSANRKLDSVNRKPFNRSLSESVSSSTTNKCHPDSDYVWGENELNTNPNISHRPLSVVTTIASGIISPTRSSAASSGGLSSPGSSSVAISSLPAAVIRTPDNGLPSLSVNSTQSSSIVLSSHPDSVSNIVQAPSTTLTVGEFRLNPAVQNLSSASSGVSSCGRSFSSNSSSSSNGSSPFNNNNCSVVTMHQTSTTSKLLNSIAPNHLPSQKLLTCATSSSAVSALNQPKTVDIASRTGSSDRKARLYSAENPSGLKLHISTNGGGSVSQPSAAFSSPMATSPLTVSIRFSCSEMDARTATITSPSTLSAHGDAFGAKRNIKGHSESHPSTPVSAPPITNMDPTRRFSSQTIDMTCDKTPLSDSNRTHSTDWFSLGSPVYESMYDKIKRRTNKEAEERRQRQQEALDAREKKRRKQRKKEQLTRSPLGIVPFTPPESFGSEHSGRTVLTNSSSGKSRGGSKSSDKAKSDSASRKSAKRSATYTKTKLTDQEFLTNGDYSCSWLSPERTWSHPAKSRPGESASKTIHKRSRKAKRLRRDRSSVSSSLSSGGGADDRNSCSPPGTLTRLSLGMRFPVSATYHECVRPKDTSRSNWSLDRDDDSLSHLSSPLSCSSSDGKSDHHLVDYSCDSHNKTLASPASNFIQSHGRTPDVLHNSKSTHTTPQTTKRDPSCISHSPANVGNSTKLNCRKGHDVLSMHNDSISKKKSQTFDSVNDRAATDKRTKHISVGSKRKHAVGVEQQSTKRHRAAHKNSSSELSSCRGLVGKLLQRDDECSHSPKPYFFDDATVLDSETDDIKCSDSVTSDLNTRTRRSAVYRIRRLSSGLHSGTDDSSVSDPRSPSSPVHDHSPLQLASHYRKHYPLNTSVCSDPHGRVGDDKDSMFDVFMDSDRFSTNSKSTPSTEPMEQSELIERNLDMKFSDDEWHSSVASPSPNRTNLEFDVDFCRGDKTEHSSTTYQSTSFSSQLISPVGKLHTPSDDSDDESLRKAVVDLAKSCTATTVASDESHKLPFEKPECASNTSPMLPETKLCFTSVESHEIKPELSDPNAPCFTLPTSTSKLSPVFKTDANPPVHSGEEDSKTNSLFIVTTNDSRVDPTATSNEPSLVSSRTHDSSYIPSVKVQETSSGSPQVVRDLKSTDISNSTEKFVSCLTTDTSNSTRLSDTSNSVITSVVTESDCSVPNKVDSKPESEVLKIASPPLCLAHQLSEKPVGQSTPKADLNPIISGVQSIRHEMKPKSGVDEVDSSKRVSITLAPMLSSPPVGRTQASATEPVKTSASHQPVGPPIEAHDIRRYVQSVIERVKAERVEESQQAAAAAAAAHFHPAGLHQASVTAAPVAVQHASNARATHEGLTSVPSTVGLIPSCGKRGVANNRRPLLVTTSACSSVKSATISSSSKWATSAIPQTSALTFGAPSTVVVTTCHQPLNVSIASTTINSCLLSSQPLSTTTDLHLPSIPGVNACAPLAVSPQLPVPGSVGRVTRQSQQQQQAIAAHGSTKRSEVAPISESHMNSGRANAAATPGGGARRRRRSEGKVSTINASKDSGNSSVPFSGANSVVTISEPTPSVATSSSVPPTAGRDTPIGKTNTAIEEPARDLASEPVQCNGPTNNIVVTGQKTRVSVDPYEPNFDDESPVGFDHGQLHHHRATPPVCSSPTPLQANPSTTTSTTTATTTRKHVSTTTSANVPCSSPSSIHSGLSPISNLGCEASSHPVSISVPEAAATTTFSTVTAATTSTSLSSSNTLASDTVDEVIRDVCAGQFDARSYINSWWTEHQPTIVRPTKASPKITDHQIPTNTSVITSASTIASTLPIVNSVTTATTTSTTVPPAAVAGSMSVCTTAPVMINWVNPGGKISTAPISSVAKPFPLAISEPVVAAVTIPVSSNAAKTITPGKNGSNNMINIATGNDVLNTILAVLQRIPGSQVTVGGGAGAISATTITLPVNAARQAAANITAAVLSATGGGAQAASNEPPTRETAQQNSAKEKLPTTECQTKPSTTSAASVLPPLTSIEPVVQHSTSVGTAQAPVPNLPCSRTAPAPTFNVVQAAASGPSLVHLANKLQPTVTARPTVTPPSVPLAKRILASSQSDPVFIDTAGLSAKSIATSLQQQQQQQQVKQIPMERATAVPAVRSMPSQQVAQSNVLHLSMNPSVPVIQPVSLHPQPSLLSTSCVGQSPVSHTHSNINMLKPPFNQIPNTAMTQNSAQQTQVRHTTRVPPSASPLIPGRSPPLSAPPLTNDAVQSLLDRFGGAFEPSVLLALAQAAAGVGSADSLAPGLESDSPALGYLRRWAQQILDTRTCSSGGGGGSGAPTTKHPIGMVVDGQGIKSAPPHVTTPPVSTVPTFPNPPRCQMSALSVNTLTSDGLTVPPARNNTMHDANALISPPVGGSRHSPNNPAALATGAMSSAHMSWNAIGQTYPLVWQGRLSLKNAETRVALHYIHGNPNLLHDCMRLLASGGGGQPQHSLVSSGGPLRIVQRMRLEPAQLEGVQRKIHQDGASCACLALPAGSSPVELVQQTQILNDSFIRYMQEKMAAGIINVGFPDYQQGLYVVHIFPPCEFSHTQLNLAAPELHRRVLQANQSHLLVVITTV